MSDISRELNPLRPTIRDTSEKGSLKEVLRRTRAEIIGIAEKKEEIGMSQLHDLALSWEKDFGDKLSEEELEAMGILLEVIGTMDFSMKHIVTEPKRSYAQSIDTCREIMKIAFSNLTPDGKPNGDIVRSLGVVNTMVENFFDVNTLKIRDPGALGQYGYWQSVQSMITSASMFHQEGWKVFFADKELDITSDVDYVVRDPRNRVFSVDLVSKIRPLKRQNVILERPFTVERVAPRPEVRRVFPHLAGTFRINIPPVRSWIADPFYEDGKVGHINPAMMNIFREKINTVKR